MNKRTDDCGTFDRSSTSKFGGVAEGLSDKVEASRLASVFASFFDCHVCTCHIAPPCNACVICPVCNVAEDDGSVAT